MRSVKNWTWAVVGALDSYTAGMKTEYPVHGTSLNVVIEHLSAERVADWSLYVQTHLETVPVFPTKAELEKLDWDKMLSLAHNRNMDKALRNLTPDTRKSLHAAFANAFHETLYEGLLWDTIVPWSQVLRVFLEKLPEKQALTPTLVDKILEGFRMSHSRSGHAAIMWLASEYYRVSQQNGIFAFSSVLKSWLNPWQTESGPYCCFVFTLRDDSEDEVWHGFEDDFNRVVFAEIAILRNDGSLQQFGLHQGPHRVEGDREWLKEMFRLKAATGLAKDMGYPLPLYHIANDNPWMSGNGEAKTALTRQEMTEQLRETQERNVDYVLPLLKSKRKNGRLQDFLQSDSRDTIRKFLRFSRE